MMGVAHAARWDSDTRGRGFGSLCPFHSCSSAAQPHSQINVKYFSVDTLQGQGKLESVACGPCF